MDPEKKKRQSKPKTRTGCITCKIRRIKCDEQKPACAKCLRTGRQCDGYTSDGRRPDKDPLQIIHWTLNNLPLRQLSSDVAGSNQERRAFHFFQQQSAVDFTGFFESSFWTRTIPQACHAEPSIRHAVMALGALHEAVQQQNWKISEGGKAQDPFALQQCNKAISHLQRNIHSDRRPSKDTLLMSCAVFICFEILQDDYGSALNHMQGGLRIYREWQATSLNPSNTGTTSTPQSAESVDGEIVQLFSRVNVQTLMFPDTHQLPLDFLGQDAHFTSGPVPSAFADLKSARDCLDSCMSYRFQAAVASYVNELADDNCTESSASDESVYQDLLEQWSAAFDAYIDNAGPIFKTDELQRVSLLKIQYKCADILLHAGLPPQEEAFDEFEDTFESIIPLSRDVMEKFGSGESPERKGDFAFDTGLVPPLYFVATRCRVPWIRREALSLLSSKPRQEGVWNSGMLSKIAEHIILVEEDQSEMSEVPKHKGVAVSSRLAVLNATICSGKRQVMVACRQEKCGTGEEACISEQLIKY